MIVYFYPDDGRYPDHNMLL